MKTVILAGGLGTRMSSGADAPPKALTPIAGRPIIDWIIEGFAVAGCGPVIVALGHRAREVEIGLSGRRSGPQVTFVDTGQATETGGRIKRLSTYLDDSSFFLSYCDNLSNVSLHGLARFHSTHSNPVSMVVAHPRSRYGVVDIENGIVTSFREKPILKSLWVNAGIFVLDRTVLDRISGDQCRFEHDVLGPLAEEGGVRAYCHDGFWQPMDTRREAEELNAVWPLPDGNAGID